MFRKMIAVKKAMTKEACLELLKTAPPGYSVRHWRRWLALRHAHEFLV